MFVGGSDERHFRVVELDKKKVEIGGVSIKPGASPGSAARKLLTSIAHQKGLKKNKKTTMSKVRFCIQEYTQGSSKKVYGPYVGHFHKYTAAELKKASTAGGKIKFTMKPVVKLSKKNNMSGGNNEEVKKMRILNSLFSRCRETVLKTVMETEKNFLLRSIKAQGENGQNPNDTAFTSSLLRRLRDVQNIGVVIYKKTEDNLLKNRNMMGRHKHTQHKLNKKTNKNKNHLTNNIKILKLFELVTEEQKKEFVKNMTLSKTGSCIRNFSGSKIRLRLKNENKEEVYCIPKNNNSIEKYTKPNNFEEGDVVFFDTNEGKWFKF